MNSIKIYLRNLKLTAQDKGQGMVEFALVLPIVLLLMFGIIEFGRLMFIYSAVTTASREAVRYGITIGENAGGIPHYLDCDGMVDSALVFGGLAGLTASDITITYDSNLSGTLDCDTVEAEDISFGDTVIVSITLTYTPGGAVPLVNLPPIPINSVVQRTIIKSAQVTD